MGTPHSQTHTHPLTHTKINKCKMQTSLPFLLKLSPAPSSPFLWPLSASLGWLNLWHHLPSLAHGHHYQTPQRRFTPGLRAPISSPTPSLFIYLPHSYQNELLWPLLKVWRNVNLFPKVTTDCLCSPYSLSPFTFPQHGLPVGLCLCFTNVTRYLSYVLTGVLPWMFPS